MPKKLKIVIAVALILCLAFPVAALASKQDYFFTAQYSKEADTISLHFGHNTGLKAIKAECVYRIDGGEWQTHFKDKVAWVGNFDRTSKHKPKNIKNGQKIEYKMKFYKDKKIVKEITAPVVVWGDTKSGSPAPSPSPPLQPPEKTIDGPDWAERLAASIIAAPAKWILGVAGLYDPIELVFGDFVSSMNEDYQKVGTLSYLSTFTENEWNALTEFYDKVSEIVPLELVLVVVFMGIAYWYSATKPDAKVSFRGCVAGLLIAMLLLRMGGMMFSFLFDVNKLLVAQFYSAVDGKISEGASFLTAFISLEQDGYIGSAILFIIGVFTVALINWQYIIRKVMIALLIGLLPVVAVISIVKRDSLVIWFRELIANIFLQASHAAVLAFLIVLGKSSGGQHGSALTTSQFWFTLVALISIPSISVLIRKLFGAEGIGTGVGGALAAGVGIGSLMAVGRALGGGSKAPAPEESTTSTGGLASKFAVKGGKALAGAAGGLAGGMIAGPGGLALGSVLGAKGAGLFTDTASSLSNFISKAKSDGALDALGLADSRQLLDPGSMYDAGQTLLGSNVFGKSAGTLMAAGAGIASRLPAYKDSASALREAQEQAKAARASIPELKSNLSDLTSQKKIAEARYDQARSLYGPKSEKMQWAQDKVSQFEGGIDEARSFISMYDRSVCNEQSIVDKMSKALSEDPSNTAAANRLESAQESLSKLHEVEPKVSNVRSAIEHIDKSTEYGEAKSHYEDVSAQEAELRMQLLKAERQQTREGLKDYFQALN
jgi:hypothetical protein